MNPIETLYGDVDNLSQFVHPKYNKTFKFLSYDNQVELADNCLNAIHNSGFHQVIVSETGANPIIYLCEQLALKRNMDIDWFKIKVPREPRDNLYRLINYYLSDTEKSEELPKATLESVVKRLNSSYGEIINDSEHYTRSELLEKVCPYINFFDDKPELNQILTNSDSYTPSIAQRCVSEILEDTAFGKKFSKPFLYFDEYINSGTTIKSANFNFKSFIKDPEFKIGTYFIYQNNSKKFEKLAFSLYDLDSELECFNFGAYPFENRVDLIGHYFFINEHKYNKITIESIFSEFNKKQSGDTKLFMNNLMSEIASYDLDTILKHNAAVPQVRDYLNNHHVARHMLTIFEEDSFGKNEYHEFLSQLAEMYGPAWSPMPRENHFDFWNALEKTYNDFRNIPGFNKLKKEYIACRPKILAMAAKICLDRRNTWLINVNKIIDEKF